MKRTALILALSASLTTGCSTIQRTIDERPVVTAVAAAIVAGSIIATVKANSRPGPIVTPNYPPAPGTPPRDSK